MILDKVPKKKESNLVRPKKIPEKEREKRFAELDKIAKEAREVTKALREGLDDLYGKNRGSIDPELRIEVGKKIDELEIRQERKVAGEQKPIEAAVSKVDKGKPQGDVLPKLNLQDPRLPGDSHQEIDPYKNDVIDEINSFSEGHGFDPDNIIFKQRHDDDLDKTD